MPVIIAGENLQLGWLFQVGPAEMPSMFLEAFVENVTLARIA